MGVIDLSEKKLKEKKCVLIEIKSQRTRNKSDDNFYHNTQKQISLSSIDINVVTNTGRLEQFKKRKYNQNL